MLEPNSMLPSIHSHYLLLKNQNLLNPSQGMPLSQEFPPPMYAVLVDCLVHVQAEPVVTPTEPMDPVKPRIGRTTASTSCREFSPTTQDMQRFSTKILCEWGAGRMLCVVMKNGQMTPMATRYCIWVSYRHRKAGYIADRLWTIQ